MSKETAGRDHVAHEPAGGVSGMEEMSSEARRELVGFFLEIIERLWARLITFIGEMATAAIFRSAAQASARAYPLLCGVEVTKEGVRMDRMLQEIDSFDRQAIRSSLLAFLDNLMGIITSLTGDVLIQKVEPIVRQFHKNTEG